MTTTAEHPPADAELEQMLAQAERLANEMRTLSRSSENGSSTGSYVPETIQIKDSATECSSMETGNANNSDSHVASCEFSTYVQEESITEEGESLDVSAELQEITTCSQKETANGDAQDVNAVIQAAEEMARALEAIKCDDPSSPPRSKVQSGFDSPDSGASSSTSPASLSPFPASPESICDSKTTAPISHVTKDPASNVKLALPSTPSKTAQDIKWEKIEYTKDSDDDYVPIKDYSKEAATHSLANPSSKDENIKWEKISAPSRADADFVPLADYSTKTATRKTLDFAPDPLSSFAHHHKALRLKRKRQKRNKIFMAAVALTAVVAVGIWKQPELTNAVTDLRKSLFPPPVPAGPTPEELAAAAAEAKAEEERLAAEVAAAQREAEIAAQKEAEERKIAQAKALEDARIANFMKQTCGLPFAGLLSPVCRQQKGGKADNAFRLQQLVQAMMQ